MKSGRLYLAISAVLPCVCYGANNPEFAAAAKLLTAAKNADIQQVQSLINGGADVNYVDSTGLSLVCTAIMNNDTRAVQILQMYGADASQCDRQIKKYKNLNNPKSTSGVFSGLSSTQGLVLSAGAGAAVVGGVLLLTDVFNPSNGNGGGSGSGGHGGGGGDDPVGPVTSAFTLPYGPLSQDVDVFSSDVYKADFDYFRPGQTDVKTNTYLTDGVTPLQNYLLMMHGYHPFSRGYMGQTTFRDRNNAPVKILNGTGGGIPMIVSAITNNGLNLAGSLGRSGGIAYADSAAADVNTYKVDKFTNFTNPSESKMGTENKLNSSSFDYDMSGSGTVFNPWATPDDSALGKIIAGWEAGERSVADLYGFIPNGRLAVYRTGGGKSWKNVENPTSGTVVATLTKGDGNDETFVQVGDKIEIGDTVYTIEKAVDSSSITNPTITISGTTYKVADDSDMLVAKEGNVVKFALYRDTDRDTDGFYYINSDGGDTADKVFYLDSNNFYNGKDLKPSAFDTFKAMYAAQSDGSAAVANLTINPETRKSSYLNIGGIKNYFSTEIAKGTATTDIGVFLNTINNYYGSAIDSYNRTPGDYANLMFNAYKSSSAITVMPAGEFAYGLGTDKSTSILDATFENYAPALYNNLEHRFMTVVAVQHATNDIANQSTISGYGDGVSSGVLYLATHNDGDNLNISRKCGVAGSGTSSVDPWCFAAAGPTPEMATASAAGAVAAVKGAFNYLTNEEVFVLLALTADGAYLGADNNGVAYDVNGLKKHLQSMYALPLDYNIDSNTSADEYLAAFKDVYGYGLINLNRATTPGNVYYYKNGERVSLDRAATNTNVNLTGVFGGRSATISAPFYDVLTSVDGEMSMPRIWENEFTLGADSKRGLYMGDVLEDFKVRKDDTQKTQFGNMALSMAMSQRPYADNLNGLDNLSLSYDNEKFGLNAGFQRYFTDGQSRFSGLSNPVLGLATNAIVTGGEYKYGNWSFGARAFSGSITDESFLQNDPTVSAQYEPLRLGLAQGGQSNIGWNNDKFSVAASFGVMHETDTVLGAQTTGLLNMGNGDTTYVDIVSTYKPLENVSLTLRSTFARTRADATGGLVLGLSELNSNAFAFGADVGNFSFSISRPLAITDGDLQYAYAKYDIAEISSGKYDLVIADAGTRNLDLSADVRETRLMGAYRHNFGEFTDGALGFIYRINPNNTNVFGNESIFMLKLTHRLGI